MTSIDFAKGHGTGNDFVIVPDPDGAHPLTAGQIAALCDRRTGIGGDGLLRVVRAAKHPDGVDSAQSCEWFMDYYNADGGIAEMCGNGIRVYARYLLDNGLADGPELPIATRAGLKTVSVDGERLGVDMGAARFGGRHSTVIGGRTYTGTEVSMGNPHLVCRTDDLAAADLTAAPEYDRQAFPGGVNIELITGASPAIGMRVHERGVGETASCGTGACAAAAVALREAQPDGIGVCAVEVPGGRLTVTVTADTVRLRGPAVIVATGTVVLR